MKELWHSSTLTPRFLPDGALRQKSKMRLLSPAASGERHSSLCWRNGICQRPYIARICPNNQEFASATYGKVLDQCLHVETQVAHSMLSNPLSFDSTSFKIWNPAVFVLDTSEHTMDQSLKIQSYVAWIVLDFSWIKHTIDQSMKIHSYVAFNILESVGWEEQPHTDSWECPKGVRRSLWLTPLPERSSRGSFWSVGWMCFWTKWRWVTCTPRSVFCH